MYTQNILTIAAFAGAAIAAPVTSNTNNLQERAPQGASGWPMCSDSTSYTVESKEPHDADWEVVSGITCRSDNDNTCTVGAGESISMGVTVTVGAGLDIGKIFSVDSSVAYTWTTTESKTVANMCPKGGYECGLMYQKKVVDVKGKKVKTITGTCGSAGQKSNEDYAFTAPALIGDSPQVTYAACIANESPVKDDDGKTGLQVCPGGL